MKPLPLFFPLCCLPHFLVFTLCLGSDFETGSAEGFFFFLPTAAKELPQCVI